MSDEMNVSQEDQTPQIMPQASQTVQPDVPRPKKPVYKTWWFWVIIAGVVLGFMTCAIASCTTMLINSNSPSTASKNSPTNQTSSKETTAPTETQQPAETTPDPKAEMFDKVTALFKTKQAFDTGSYVKGDIPAGDYAFVTFEGSGQYYEESDTVGNILDNENFDSFGYVHVWGKGNIKTDGALVNVSAFQSLGVSGAKQLWEILNSQKDYFSSGQYKIGADLPAGSYTFQSTGEGYVSVDTGPVGNSDIVDNENFNGKYQTTVKNGQYLKVSRADILR